MMTLHPTECLWGKRRRISMEKREAVAELQYSPEYRRIELVVPYGTKMAELGRIKETLFTDIINRLPRGCQPCLSGEPLFIRERLEHVIQVDLESMQVL
jgi:hypothetical protein